MSDEEDFDVSLIIDATINDGSKKFSTKHILDKEGVTFSNAVSSIFEEYALTQTDLLLGNDYENPTQVAVQGMMGRIKSIYCAGNDAVQLYKFMERSNMKLKFINSSATPIFKRGIIINLGPEHETTTQEVASGPTAFDLLMGTGELKAVKHLDVPEDVSNPTIDKQIKKKLYITLNEQKLGYFSNTQKDRLTKNIDSVVSSVKCIRPYCPTH